ncbi:MAG: Gfo/Idh/MocA family oxidoreductase [Sphingobacterium sp.]|nr:Gfo/Idh/MocA family oxidoreductase [Sphingobacterium sp.]
MIAIDGSQEVGHEAQGHADDARRRRRHDDDLQARQGPGGPAPPAREPPGRSSGKKPSRPVTAAIMGAGGRGRVYAAYAKAFPEELRIVGVAEPIPYRNAFLAEAHAIPPERRWPTWERAFDGPKFCDAIIVTTPDRLHYGPAMAALDQGYDLLLEKAIAQSWPQCRDILDRAAARAGASSASATSCATRPTSG